MIHMLSICIHSYLGRLLGILGSLTSSLTSFRLLSTLGTDFLPRGTNNSTLVLDSATSTLGTDLNRDTLLVDTTVDLGPADFARAQTLQKVRLGLTVDETEGLQEVLWLVI